MAQDVYRSKSQLYELDNVMKNPDNLLNILYVGTLPPHRGGSAISGSQLIIEFSRLGHKIRSIAPITPEGMESGDKFKQEHPELNILRFLLPYFETSPNIPPSDEYRKLEKDEIQKNLAALIEKDKPDIIVAGRETYAWHVPDIATEYSVPSILRAAGSTINGILNQTIPVESAKNLIAQYKKFELLISPARHLENSIRGLGIQKIITIINAIDTEQFSPRGKNRSILNDLQIDSSGFIIGHISNMKSIKQPFDIVDSAEIILNDNPDIVYLIVGDGYCLEEMKQRCMDKKISSKFRFTGWVNYEQIPEYLNLFDVFVMPSSAEGLARVCLETQACGKCLVVSDIAPTHEIIKDGETGLIFKLGDIKDLTDKILMVYNDENLRSSMGKNARKRINEHSINNAAKKYIDTFKKVIEDYKSVSNCAN